MLTASNNVSRGCPILKGYASTVAAEAQPASPFGAADAGSAADREEQTLVGSFTKLDLSPQSPSSKESLHLGNPSGLQLAGEHHQQLGNLTTN